MRAALAPGELACLQRYADGVDREYTNGDRQACYDRGWLSLDYDNMTMGYRYTLTPKGRAALAEIEAK